MSENGLENEENLSESTPTVNQMDVETVASLLKLISKQQAESKKLEKKEDTPTFFSLI